MKLTIARLARPVLLGLLALTIFTLGSSAARADEVFFSGSTLGCFGAGCVPAHPRPYWALLTPIQPFLVRQPAVSLG